MGRLWAAHRNSHRPAVRNPKRAAHNVTATMAPSAAFVWGLCEDSSGALWAGAESGLWRWKPGPPKRYAMPGMRISDLTKADDGRLLDCGQRRRTPAGRWRQSSNPTRFEAQ